MEQPNRERDGSVEPGHVSARYQEFLAEVLAADDFRTAVLARAASERQKEVDSSWRASLSAWRDLSTGRLAFGPDPSLPTPARLRDLALNHATNDQKKNELFPVVTSRYWVEALAADLLERLAIAPSELRALQLIHDMSVQQLKANRSGTRTIARIVAAVSFIISLIPAETFDALGWGGYGWFRGVMAVIAAAAIAFALLLQVSDRWIGEPPESRALNRARRLAPLVLTYCDALIGLGAPDGNPSPVTPPLPTT